MQTDQTMLAKPARALAGVLSALLLSSCSPPPPEEPVVRPVNAMRVADVSGLTKNSFPGRATAGQEVNLSFRVSGPLIALPVNVGDEVREGDLVARIDPADFENAVRTMEAQLERERAQARRTQADLDRQLSILKEDPGATSQAVIDHARHLRDSTAASVRSLEATLETARNQLAYTSLEAPFDGVIVETYVENFETVITKQPIMRLLDPSSIEFVVNVPESLIGYAPHVKKVTVTFDALPGVELPAEIKKIGREASQATRTYPVTLFMSQPEEGEILPGMAGEALIAADLPEKASRAGIEIPATAVFSGADGEKSYVWVVDEASSTLGRREVEAGRLSRFGVLIKGGLEPGEWIVVKGVHSVAEGQKVRILDVSQGSAPS